MLSSHSFKSWQPYFKLVAVGFLRLQRFVVLLYIVTDARRFVFLKYPKYALPAVQHPQEGAEGESAARPLTSRTPGWCYII